MPWSAMIADQKLQNGEHVRFTQMSLTHFQYFPMNIKFVCHDKFSLRAMKFSTIDDMMKLCD